MRPTRYRPFLLFRSAAGTWRNSAECLNQTNESDEGKLTITRRFAVRTCKADRRLYKEIYGRKRKEQTSPREEKDQTHGCTAFAAAERTYMLWMRLVSERGRYPLLPVPKLCTVSEWLSKQKKAG